jgi:hypothetical protein
MFTEPKKPPALKSSYPKCACGCGKDTNSSSPVVGYPYSKTSLWCATAVCASNLKKKLAEQYQA